MSDKDDKDDEFVVRRPRLLDQLKPPKPVVTEAEAVGKALKTVGEVLKTLQEQEAIAKQKQAIAKQGTSKHLTTASFGPMPLMATMATFPFVSTQGTAAPPVFTSSDAPSMVVGQFVVPTHHGDFNVPIYAQTDRLVLGNAIAAKKSSVTSNFVQKHVIVHGWYTCYFKPTGEITDLYFDDFEDAMKGLMWATDECWKWSNTKHGRFQAVATLFACPYARAVKDFAEAIKDI